MNLVFLQGKIVSDIQFEFIINSKNIAIAIFEIELTNKSVVKCKGYNEVADFCCSKLKIGDKIFCKGYINTKIEIIVNTIELYRE